MNSITVIGAGPAGSAAAISARLAGADVRIYDKSRFPRHKVCGEFISPEIFGLLSELGIERSFIDASPARIKRLILRYGSGEKTTRLPEPAYGLSRFAFDRLLLEHAINRGIEFVRGTAPPGLLPVVIAHGRQAVAREHKGHRRFGFKAHFSGPVDDAVELHFFNSGYVGISTVENGVTNVCGLATVARLEQVGYDYDALIAGIPSLAARLSPLHRMMDWLTTGPLVFGNRFRNQALDGIYAAGDALSFVDPFTGSGMYCAILSGAIAGRAAASGLPAKEHLERCRKALGRPFAFAGLARAVISSALGARFIPFVPATCVYRLTRPPAPRRK